MAQGIFEACGREHYGPPKYLGKLSIVVSASALGICFCSFFNYARWFSLLFQNSNACVILHGCIGIRHVSALADLNSMDWQLEPWQSSIAAEINFLWWFLYIGSLIYHSTFYRQFYWFGRFWWNHPCCLQVILNDIWNKLAWSNLLPEWFAVWASNDMNSNALLKTQNKMNIPSGKRKMDLLIACSYIEVWVNSCQFQASLNSELSLFNIRLSGNFYVFSSKPWIEYLYFRIVLDWRWVVNLSNRIFVTIKQFITLQMFTLLCCLPACVFQFPVTAF